MPKSYSDYFFLKFTIKIFLIKGHTQLTKKDKTQALNTFTTRYLNPHDQFNATIFNMLSNYCTIL